MSTIRLTPSTYSLSSTTYLSVSNESNLYQNTDNESYATITNSRSSTTSYLVYLKGFDFDSVPEGATIDSFKVKIKIRESGVTTSTSYRMTLMNNTTSLSIYADTMPSTTTSTIEFNTSSVTWETLKQYGSNLSIAINARRASRNTTGYLYIYGAEIEVNYTEKVEHTITSTVIHGVMNSENPLIVAEGATGTEILFSADKDYIFKEMTVNGTYVTPTKNPLKAADNITVTYSTNYATYSTYSLDNCHDGSNSTYFWSNGSQSVGKYILMEFSEPVDLTEFSTYSSSSSDYPGSNNVLQVSSDGSTWTTAGIFSDSTTTSLTDLSAKNISYARIYSNTANSNWLVLNEISMTYAAAGADTVDYDYKYTFTESITEDKTVVIIFAKESLVYLKIDGEWTPIQQVYKKVDGV